MAKAILKECGVAKNQRFLAGRHPSASAHPSREGGWGDPRQRERHLTSLKLILLLSLTPTTALAEVCDTLRPNWIPGTQTTQISEAVHLFSSAPALVLLVASVIAVVKRSAWGALIIVFLWSGLVTLITFFADDGIQEFALAEGCIASPALFIGTVTAICIAMILKTMPRETRL